MEIVYGALFFAMLIACFISWCTPWTRLAERRALIQLQIPIAVLIVLFVLYEAVARQIGLNIRIDLFFLGFPIIITLGLYALRMILAAIKLRRGQMKGVN